MTTRNATVRWASAMDRLRLPRKELAVLAAHLPDVRRSLERLAGERAEERACVAVSVPAERW